MRVLNLGAGVQSTSIFLMIIDGELPPVDFAIFADCGDEPKAVYNHIERLKKLCGPEIVTVSEGNLADNLVSGLKGDGGRFVSIPAYMESSGERSGIGRRQCTSEYKLKPIEREIRRRCGLTKGERMPKETRITQVFGLSFDEPRRVERVKANFHGRGCWSCEFPLFEDRMTREDCVSYLKKRLPEYTVPRSACVFCPFKRDSEWKLLKETDPTGWQRAVEVDQAIRKESSVCTKGMNSRQYLHKSCKPLDEIEFKDDPPELQKRFTWSSMDCEGMCGN